MGDLLGSDPTLATIPDLTAAVVILTGIPSLQFPLDGIICLPDGPVLGGGDPNGSSVPEPGTIVLLSSGSPGWRCCGDEAGRPGGSNGRATSSVIDRRPAAGVSSGG